VPIALAFIAVICIGNLRGVKESGKLFAVPTYAFIFAMFLMIGTGIARAVFGGGIEHVVPEDPVALESMGAAGIVLLLHAFASGGAAMTGVEAISNGVPAFKPVEWKHARETLTVMGILLGSMFLGISWLASKMQIVPSESKTVIAQMAQAVYGTSPLGHALFFFTQAATMLILVLAANTSFADFPRLASFHADDAFMPKQLTKRGHRLVFSNGIIALAIAGAIPVIIFQADVTHLIPLYAIGVFTSFTLSQAGMARKHVKDRERGWQLGLFVNGLGAVTTAVVTIVIGVFKFTGGAWFIMLLVPILVLLLMRLNRQYESEGEELKVEAERVTSMVVRRRHSVVVMVGELDMSTVRALQYARALSPDEMKAVHIAVDEEHAADLMESWAKLDLDRIPLEVIQCPNRRMNRATLEMAVAMTYDERTELTVLVPRREYTRLWHRLLHDRTGESIADTLSNVPHVNVTFVPYHMGASAIDVGSLSAPS
jgi:amino acid transporter